MGQPLLSILECRVRGNANGQEMLSVFHYRVSAVSTLAASGPEENEFINQFASGGTLNLQDVLLDCQSSSYLCTGIDAQFVDPTRLVSISQTFASPGSVASPVGAQNVSAVVTRRTVLAGRSQVSTLHIPGIATTSYALGKVTAGMLASMNILATRMTTQLVALVGGGIYTPVIWHRKKFPLVGSSDIVNSTLVQETIRTMRRRTIGIGI